MLTKERGASFASAANHIGAWLAAARYAATRCSTASATAVTELSSLFKHAKREAKQAALFNAT